MNPPQISSLGRPHPCSGPRALSCFIALSVATAAAAFLTCSCEKEPEAWAPPAPPPPAGVSTPSAAPGPPAVNASGPAVGDAFKEAARKHFDATAFVKKRALQQKQSAGYQARKQARENSGRKQPPAEMMKETNDDFVARRELEEKTTTWRARWEAKEWAGYPLPESPDPAVTNPPITRYDVTDEDRAVPPYLPASAHQAWEDFWRRNDARLNQLVVAHSDQMKAKSDAALAAASAGDFDETVAARKARMDQVLRQNVQMTTQAKADLDAFIERTISTANAWRTKNWEGYTAPADPNALPPETAGTR
jgi:hypothetical protein